MRKNLFTIFVCLLFGSAVIAQEIPNWDFENWTGNNPNEWFANNPPSGPQTVTPSSDSHSGSLSARLEVVETDGVPIPPQIASGTDGNGFVISERYTGLRGFYKFAPQVGDFLQISVSMYIGGQQGNQIGQGVIITQSAFNEWTEITAPISYFEPGTPDWCAILITIVTVTDFGGVAYVDNLAFDGATDVQLITNNIPNRYELNQNYPNPFNPSTIVEYSIPSESFVELKVYDILGNEVATLVNEQQQAGVYRADFTADNLPSGMYFARISANDFTQVIKMTLLK
jgi:Secretion system C-terminal sorting domain